MKNWNTPSLVELNTKFTADGGNGTGDDKQTRTIIDPVNGNTVVTTTFSTFIPGPNS